MALQCWRADWIFLMKLFAKLALLGLAVAILFMAFVKGRDILTERKAAKEAAISMDMLASLPASDYTLLRQRTSNADFNIKDLSNAEHGDFKDLVVIGPGKHVFLTFFNPANIRAERDQTSIVLDRNLEHILITKTGTPLRVFRSYLLRREGYYSFLLDGNTSLVPFERYASDIPVTNEMIRALYESSPYYRYDEYALRNANHSRIGIIKAHVFFIEGRWVEVRSDTDLDTNLPAKGQDELSANQSASLVEVMVPSYLDEENSAQLSGRGARIALDHFLKETYYKGRGAVIGDPTGTSLAPAWSGQAYYTLEIDGKEIQFVWPHYLRAQTYLYSNPAIDFILVASKIGRQYVLISPKSDP